MDLVAGQLIGDFELVSPAGAGGFSVVWKAKRSATSELVALKFPRVEALLDHLRREAGVSQRVSHPRLVPIIETHLDAEPPHLVMPWVEGERLETRESAPPPLEIVNALRVVRDLASVLATLHEEGIAHGDVKPGNVLVDGDGRCHLLDLGLAGAQVATRLERSLAQSLVSVDGRSIAGTLDFMAPELFDGKGAGVAGDVYSLGVLLHQALTGRPPAFGVAPSALNPYLPPGTEDLLRRMLHHDPEHRARSAGAVRDDLDDLIALEKRCLARKNGHERRRVFLSRLATVRRGLRALLVGSTLALGLVVLVAGANAASGSGQGSVGELIANVAAVLGILGLLLCSTFLPILLGMTTINAWIMGIPEKTYKNRAGHPLWSFMMQ